MASFDPAFVKTMKAEEGYSIDPKNPESESYKGIVRKSHIQWKGWTSIDALKAKKNFPKNLDSDIELQKIVKTMYQKEYWERLAADQIENQAIADSIFDFSVQVGVTTSLKLVQLILGVDPSGIMGEATLTKLNEEDPRAFLAVFALQKIRRFVSLGEKPENKKVFLGWIKRALEV